MALKYPDILQSNNPNAYGIVPATEVSGHKQVANLTALYALADPILSLSGTNTNNDAIGQLWYVAGEGKHYQLVDWANRKNANGWKVFKSGGGGGTIVFSGIIAGAITDPQTIILQTPENVYYSTHLAAFVAKGADNKYYYQWADTSTILAPEEYGDNNDGVIRATMGLTYQNKTDGKLWVYDGGTDLAPVDTNTTYSPQSLGFGYGICETAAATAAKTATLAGYALIQHGIVAVKFTNSVPANATLNINSKGAKPIFYRGSAIVAGVVNAGDVATFIYDGTNYIYLGTDNALSRAGGKMTGGISWETTDAVESTINADGYEYNEINVVSMDDDGDVVVTGDKIAKTGGTSDQVLMADGSVAGTITTDWLEANLT